MDVLTKEQRSRNMKAIRSKNTKIEVILAKSLWAKGLRYRKNNKNVFGKPDFTFKKYKIAIFCDGEFFHGKDWETAKNRIKSNREFWLAKIAGNIKRDEVVNETLKKEGWTVEELGYSLHCKVIHGKHFVPQHRERIFIVGFDKTVFKGNEEFSFPELPNPEYIVEKILEKEVDEKYTLSNNLWEYLQNYAKKHKEKGNGFGFGLVDFEGITRTISARYYKDGSEILIPQENKNPRRLTPRECARLQGYPENFIIPVSDTQAYKQFGNSVVKAA